MAGMLHVDNLTKHFGGLTAVEGLSFDVEENAILGLIGPNGSGKTTSLDCINGLYKPDKGSVVFRGQEVQGFAPHHIARVGIGRTFQVPKIFKHMTVLENMLTPVLSSPQTDGALREKARGLLDEVNLLGDQDRMGEDLSGGQQKLLELIRALMSDPGLLLLDEPFAGIHPAMKTMFYEKILQMRERGKTFILVSHDLTSVYTLCERIVVMDLGQKIAEGTADQIKQDERVIEAYLGA